METISNDGNYTLNFIFKNEKTYSQKRYSKSRILLIAWFISKYSLKKDAIWLIKESEIRSSLSPIFMVKCTRENRYVAKQWQKDKHIKPKEIGYLFFFHTFILLKLNVEFHTRRNGVSGNKGTCVWAHNINYYFNPTKTKKCVADYDWFKLSKHNLKWKAFIR